METNNTNNTYARETQETREPREAPEWRAQPGPESRIAGATAERPPFQQEFWHKPENAFKPETTDLVFAIAAFVLGYLFSRWLLFTWSGWGVTMFTTTYLVIITAYMIKKGVFQKKRAAFFWLAVTWLTGVSFALWGNAGFNGIRALFLFCAAVYYVIIASGREIMGKTGNFLLLDGINSVVIVPFRNLFNQYVSFSVLGKGGRRGKALPAILGVALALILAAIIIPMLEQADSGGFGAIMDFLRSIIRIDAEIIIYIAFAIPVAAYLYGLVSGAAHGKGTDIIKRESAEKTVSALRIFQPATVYTVLGVVCAIYLVFILSQIPYFFSAFTGARPAGWLIYSEYARRGFFELCGIATINMVVLTIGNVTSKKLRKSSVMLKAFNISLAAITLALIATAFSKMALYIGAYGLTMPRLLPCVFMLFLTVVFVALIVLQKKDFSIVRFALVLGSVMLCAMCLSNPDALVVRYNTDRYLRGTLPGYDVKILHRAGSAGVLPALEVLDATNDKALKHDLAFYLRLQNGASEIWGDGEGHMADLESYLAQERLKEARSLFEGALADQ